MASIEPLGGDKYKIYVELGYDDNGKRKRKTKTVLAKSDRALKKLATAFELEVHNNLEEINVENINFSTFVERWLEMYVKPDLTYKTYYTYKSYLNNGILESLGNMKLNKIKTYHLVKFFKEQKEQGKGSLPGKYLCLKSIFSKAIKWDVLKDNPTAKLDPPENNPRYREFGFYDEGQMNTVIKALDQAYPKLRIQAKIAMMVGMRMAEIAGIRIENINFNDNTIYVDKTLQRDRENSTFVLGPTKTKKTRTVDVPRKLMREIKEYVKDQKKLRLKCGNAWTPLLDDQGQPINLLFTNPVGYPNHPNSMANEWAKFIKRHQLPFVNFHGLRHSCASFLVSKGKNFKIIQEQLGHADIKETINRYSHLTEKDKAEAISVFDELL